MQNREEIKKLNDYQHLRIRTEMYLGSRSPVTKEVLLYNENMIPYLEVITWTPAIYTCFREILDNSIDELIGFNKDNKKRMKIDISYDEKNLVFVVKDNGRGIPVEWREDEKCYVPELALCNVRTGRNFVDNRGHVVGINGIGASAVNFTSEYFKLITIHNNIKYSQKYSEGVDNLIIEKPKIKKYEKDIESGTCIEFKPSSKVYQNVSMPDRFIRSRIIDVAICYPDIQFTYNGERIKINQNLFEKKIELNLYGEKTGLKSKFLIIPNFVENGDHTHSIVNGIPLMNSPGIHTDTFKKYFPQVLLSSLEKESKKRKLEPNRSDVMENILLYNISYIDSPKFSSQNKQELIGEDVGEDIKKALSNNNLFKKLIRENSWWIDFIYERCKNRTLISEEKEVAKTSKKILKKKIPKLFDANNSSREKCILFLTEGDSALSGLISARNPSIHGGMPLRGKIMNVSNESVKNILNNNEISDIMSAIGLKMGVSYSSEDERNELRYGKIYIATDQDPDGQNISLLLINLFYKFWPGLFRKPSMIHLFMTPFIIVENGKNREYFYNDEYFPVEKYKGKNITRAKGLGSLTREDWLFSLNNPRTLEITDDGALSNVLNLIFNDELSDVRKKWLGGEYGLEQIVQNNIHGDKNGL